MVEKRHSTIPQDDMEQLAGDDFENPGGSFTADSRSDGKGEHYSFSSKADPWADSICQWYITMKSDAYIPIKGGFLLSAPIAIIAFALFVSSSTSSLLAFAAWVISTNFIIFSIWMLGWILDKEIGPRSM